jgi:phenylalanyl-tRNA synthetase beta subunit
MRVVYVVVTSFELTLCECVCVSMHSSSLALCGDLYLGLNYTSSTPCVIQVVYEEAPAPGITVQITPQLELRRMEASLDTVRSMVGAPIADSEAVELAGRMQLHGRLRPAEPGASVMLEIGVPPTRSDILHECDIVEGW